LPLLKFQPSYLHQKQMNISFRYDQAYVLFIAVFVVGLYPILLFCVMVYCGDKCIAIKFSRYIFKVERYNN